MSSFSENFSLLVVTILQCSITKGTVNDNASQYAFFIPQILEDIPPFLFFARYPSFDAQGESKVGVWLTRWADSDDGSLACLLVDMA